MNDPNPQLPHRLGDAPQCFLPDPAIGLGVAALVGAPAVAAVALVLVGPAPSAIIAAVAAHLAASGAAVALIRRGYPHGTIGACDLATLARLGLTAALVAPLLASASGWAVVAVALVAFSLDGVDGWLARRTRRACAFGARFDMEVDAALGLVLAANAWQSGTIGVAVLVLGLPRYVFLAAGRVWPWMMRPLPDRTARKVVCVMQIAALIALQAPAVSGSLAAALVAVTAAALAWSFGRDLLWLRRAPS